MRYGYFTYILCCYFATFVVEANDDNFKYSLQKFYESKSSGTSYSIYETKDDIINKKPSFQSGYGECTMLYLGKGYLKISGLIGPGRFQKVKILDCPSNRRGEGKIGYYYGFWGGVYYDEPNKYDTELSRIFSLATKKKDLTILAKLKTDFAHHQIASEAVIVFDKVNKEKNKNAELAYNEKLSILSELKASFENAFNSIEKMNTFTKNWSSNSVFRRNKFDLNAPVYYRDGVNQKQYDRLYSNLVSDTFRKYQKTNTIASFEQFIELFPTSDLVASAESEIYALVSHENNISGFNWFIENYHSSKQAKQALINMHKLAFDLAEDINTINAYNDFVIAYPTAKQVPEANDRAYALEKSEYKSMLSFFSEEKDARRLLVQSKMLEQSAEGLSSDAKVGYMMVVNRMNDLLKQEFNSTDAALRHLESNEFKSFVRAFKSSMSDLKRQVSRIADNTADLSTIMKNQSSMMNSHFENAAQDREMASELTKQHRHWERFIGEVGL